MLTLPPEFYFQDTKVVAKKLLGKILVCKDGNRRLAGRITEVEAYLGVRDRACHTYGGRRTKRTETMYRMGGCAYVYLIYGLYNCLNVVTQGEGVPEAVLIRALEPLDGLPFMARRRKTGRVTHLTTGPGKLTQALGITRSRDGVRLDRGSLQILDQPDISSRQIVRVPRVGVDYAGTHAKWPLRYYIKNSPFISKP